VTGQGGTDPRLESTTPSLVESTATLARTAAAEAEGRDSSRTGRLRVAAWLVARTPDEARPGSYSRSQNAAASAINHTPPQVSAWDALRVQPQPPFSEAKGGIPLSGAALVHTTQATGHLLR
jgi:hypothetical protein